MSNFLDKLGDFKQKKIYTSKCIFFYILKQQTQSPNFWLIYTDCELRENINKVLFSSSFPSSYRKKELSLFLFSFGITIH